MRNHLKRILSLMLVVLCMTSFSVTAFASGGEAITEPETETTTGTDTPSTDETAEDAEEMTHRVTHISQLKGKKQQKGRKNQTEGGRNPKQQRRQYEYTRTKSPCAKVHIYLILCVFGESRNRILNA